MTGAPFGDLYVATEVNLQRLRSEHNVCEIEVREHDWIEMTKTGLRVKQFLKESDCPEPLEPRSALYGGWTCAFRLRYMQGPGESVHNVDFTPLYPYVNCSREYPLGHPEIIHSDFKEPTEYFGFIKARVHLPRGLYFPVLPYKTAQGKLVFTLCCTCAEDNIQQSSRSHDEKCRALTGVWVTEEFNKALESG